MPLVPRRYGGFPSYQFNSPHQFSNRYYNGGYGGLGASFAPQYLQQMYQLPFNSFNGFLSNGYDQVQRSSIGNQFLNFFNQLDGRYRYEQNLRTLQTMQTQGNSLPWQEYSDPLLDYHTGLVYNYIKETKYLPYPIFVDPSGRSIGSPWNLGAGGGMGLTPKIRVIFMPTGQSFLQQPCTGPLTMPSFLYNRIAQPLCSFPLPPPLPQLNSLCLTPAVQEMIMQRYSNPVAVLPFTPNWQMSPWMMSGYPQIPQQPMIPMSYPVAPQSYIPPPISTFPSAPQPYISAPAPMPTLPWIPSAPQSYIPPAAPIPTFPSAPPAPQSYTFPPPAPPTMPPNPPILAPPPLQMPLPDANTAPPLPQYLQSGYPSICRACPPAPPPLGIPVTGHCWVQHCSACHHVPTPISNPNTRPNGGRITPLLRQPTVPQYVPDQTGQQQQQQYLYNSAPVMMRPWLRKTPPLPPGAVIISDEYIDRNGSYSQYGHSQHRREQYQYNPYTKRRSTTVISRMIPQTVSSARNNSRSISPRKTNRNNSNSIQQQGPKKSKSVTSTSSSRTSSTDITVELQKLTMPSSNSRQNFIPSALTSEARRINLRYNYPSQDVSNVYLLNRYLKSNSDASTISSNLEKSSDCTRSLVKEHSQISSPSSDLYAIKEESNTEKEDEQPSRPLSQPKLPKERLIIIREFMTNSPSTISTISSDIAFSIIDKDTDSISTTSTIKANKL